MAGHGLRLHLLRRGQCGCLPGRAAGALPQAGLARGELLCHGHGRRPPRRHGRGRGRVRDRARRGGREDARRGAAAKPAGATRRARPSRLCEGADGAGDVRPDRQPLQAPVRGPAACDDGRGDQEPLQRLAQPVRALPEALDRAGGSQGAPGVGGPAALRLLPDHRRRCGIDPLQHRPRQGAAAARLRRDPGPGTRQHHRLLQRPVRPEQRLPRFLGHPRGGAQGLRGGGRPQRGSGDPRGRGA